MSKPRKRPKKRKRPSRRVVESHEDAVVGYFASGGLNVMCDGDACIIASSREQMNQIMARQPGHPPQPMSVRPTTFGEIMQGLKMGAAYAFDEGAYAILLPLAQRCGLPLGPEDFTDPGPHGVHLVRIQLLLGSR